MLFIYLRGDFKIYIFHRNIPKKKIIGVGAHLLTVTNRHDAEYFTLHDNMCGKVKLSHAHQSHNMQSTYGILISFLHILTTWFLSVWELARRAGDHMFLGSLCMGPLTLVLGASIDRAVGGHNVKRRPAVN